MKCIDCDKIISCNKNGEVCSGYKHTPKTITRLEEKDGDYFKFEKMEENEENSIEEDIKILEEKMNKELDFLIGNANKTEQITATSIIAMKEPIILLFLSILSDYKRVLKENETNKRLAKMNFKNAEEFKDNMCEHRCLLKSEIKEIQQENEELKSSNRKLYEIGQEMCKQNKYTSENYIPIQKVKDKIKKLQNEKEEYYSQYKIDELNNQIQVLQELLEGRE